LAAQRVDYAARTLPTNCRGHISIRTDAITSQKLAVSFLALLSQITSQSSSLEAVYFQEGQQPTLLDPAAWWFGAPLSPAKSIIWFAGP
jgi:hypothetical protein